MNRNHLFDGLAIEALHAGDSPRLLAHFARLSPDDRALRFNSALIDDTQIARYVDQMRFDQDLILGLVDATGNIVGVAHGCVFDAGGERRIEAAFSVDADCRGRGFGGTLMRSLQAAAPQRSVSAIVGLCATRNAPMRRIFERAGMALTREDGELHARLALKPTDTAAVGTVRSGRSGKRIA